MNLHNILRMAHGQCPPQCNACQEACVEGKGDGNIGLIRAIHIPEIPFDGVGTCLQCGNPICENVCPTGAVSKDPRDGVVKIAEEKCVGCGLCTIACPYGGIFYDPYANKAVKCDLCGGEPKCVPACEQGILTFQKMQETAQHLGKDLVSAGTSFCQGCGAEQLIRFSLRVLGEKVIVFGGPGCSLGAIAGTDMGVAWLGPTFVTFMTNLPSTAAGAKRYYDRIGEEVICVAFGGDGLTADVGFQPLSGAAERGEKILYICCDNEAYMNTGIQRSSTTPFMAQTTTTPVGEKSQGKKQTPKNIPLLMTLHDGVSYVATAAHSHLEDLTQKLIKAKQMVKEGMVYIHLFSPCPTGWGTSTNSALQLARLAVETNYFPLWEAEKKKIRFTYRVKHPKPVMEFFRSTNRFRHLEMEDFGPMQDWVDNRMKFMESLADPDTRISGDKLAEIF